MICCHETEHYVFHYLENSIAARDIETIAAEQERCYEKICRLLNMKKVADKVGIPMDEKEFHCRGQFKSVHKGRPDELNAAMEAEGG